MNLNALPRSLNMLKLTVILLAGLSFTMIGAAAPLPQPNGTVLTSRGQGAVDMEIRGNAAKDMFELVNEGPAEVVRCVETHGSGVSCAALALEAGQPRAYVCRWRFLRFGEFDTRNVRPLCPMPNGIGVSN